MVLFRTAPDNLVYPTDNRNNQFTVQQFKEWLKSIDRDGDGKISKKELRQALRVLGMRSTRWKAWRALVHADLNHNKHIDGDDEVEELIKYATKRWGIVVV